MRKTIRIELSEASINRAIQELEQFKNWIEAKTKALNERLAEVARERAAEVFGAAEYDGENDVEVYANPTSNGWEVIANGKAVFFIEFGAGVFHNTGPTYPEERPEGIVGIGEYGKGRGKQIRWRYKGADGEVHISYGNPAYMPMWKGREEAFARLQQIVTEVFG